MNDRIVKVIEILKSQRHLLVPGAATLCLLVAALIAIPRLIAYKPKPAPNSNASRTRDNAPAPLAVPQEDFFYPEEPDFLPKVLLDREPRRNWTPQDAAPFWKEPAGEDPQEWRGHIETVINELLEGVP